MVQAPFVGHDGAFIKPGYNGQYRLEAFIVMLPYFLMSGSLALIYNLLRNTHGQTRLDKMFMLMSLGAFVIGYRWLTTIVRIKIDYYPTW